MPNNTKKTFETILTKTKIYLVIIAIVLVILCESDDMKKMNEENFGEILDSTNQEEICNIDGMQRSNIYIYIT